jgi:glycosyltransferase involved in cell wall biosynthesis
MQYISLIIPAKNEKESLEKTIHEVLNYKFINEIIIVVDSRQDNSVSIAKKINSNKIRIITQKKNGYGSAIIEGFNHAKNKYACIFNADYSFDPKFLKNMIGKNNKYQFVFGSRYVKNASSNDDTIITFIGNKIFTFLSKMLLKIKLTDILLTYVLCNVKCFKNLKLKSHDFRLCIELPLRVHQKKYFYIEIPTRERKRFSGKKKVNELKDGFLILLEILYSFYKKFQKSWYIKKYNKKLV